MSIEAMKLVRDAIEQGIDLDLIGAKHILDQAIEQAADKESLTPDRRVNYAELDRIASDLQDLCDKQAIRIGHLEMVVAAGIGREIKIAMAEANDKRLEALTQPEQEPVAKYSDIVSDGGLDPRNTTPPQRTWVGLTGFEQKELMAMNARDAVFATEAKLKEQNT